MSSPQEMKTAPDSPAKKSSRAVAPATTKAQGHRLSTTNSTATGTPVGSASNHDLPTAAEVLREALGIRLRAEESLRAADPLAAELYQSGFRDGVVEGERRAGERAEKAADGFLNYLAEDPAATPGEIPPLQRTRRHLGVAA